VSLAKNLTKVRKRADLSQAELARRIKKSRSSVNEYEKGDHEPPLDVLKIIAKVCGCELGELVA